MATNAATLAKTGKFGDLRRRLVFLLLALVVYRVGAHIPVPGINPDQLAQLFQGQQGGILSLFNMFSGGALSRFTVFDLTPIRFRPDGGETVRGLGSQCHQR